MDARRGGQEGPSGPRGGTFAPDPATASGYGQGIAESGGIVMRATVRDVMTPDVVAVTEETPFRDIADTLISRGISAMPVVDGDGRVVGVVSEADLLAKEEFKEQYYGETYRPPLRSRLDLRPGKRAPMAGKAVGDTAGQLMTTPAVTIGPEESVVAAARRMDEYGVKRLPVIGTGGRLLGIVSRHDILGVFSRRDSEIAEEVRDEVVKRTLWGGRESMGISVDSGIVTLSGSLERRSEADIAVRLTRRLDGVVDVVDRLTWDIDDTLPSTRTKGRP